MEKRVKKLTFNIRGDLFCEFLEDELICRDKPFDLLDLVMEEHKKSNKGRVIELVRKGGYPIWVKRLKEDYDHAIELIEEEGF